MGSLSGGQSVSSALVVDWLSFTVPSFGEWASPYFVLCWLGLGEWVLGRDVVERSGRYGYRRMWRVGGEGGHVEIMFDGHADMGVHVQITGQGCRWLEDLGIVTSWQDFLRDVHLAGFRVSRCDVAIDDRAGRLDVGEMVRLFRAGEVVTKYRMRVVTGAERAGAGAAGVETVYFGDVRQGETGIRVYDKRVERIAAGCEDPGAWVRVELVVRDEPARDLVRLVAGKGLAVAAGVVLRKLDFVQRSSDSNRWRWRSYGWWVEFLRYAREVVLARRERGEASLTRTREVLARQAARGFARLVLGLGSVQEVAGWLLREGKARLDARDWALIGAVNA